MAKSKRYQIHAMNRKRDIAATIHNITVMNIVAVSVSYCLFDSNWPLAAPEEDCELEPEPELELEPIWELT